MTLKLLKQDYIKCNSGNPYEEIEEIIGKLTGLKYFTAIVDIHTKYDFEDSFMSSYELLCVDEKSGFWENDWYEGQNEVYFKFIILDEIFGHKNYYRIKGVYN